MKRLPVLLVSSLALFLFSCSSEPAKEESKAADTTAVASVPPPAPEKPAFVPFKIIMIQHLSLIHI